MGAKINIPKERKCYGTFDLDYHYNQDDVPTHGKRLRHPQQGILSFEHNDYKVEIEFTEKQFN